MISMMTSKKTRGFMCQSPAATAVCMASDSRSVIVPRRSGRTLNDNKRLIKNAKYYSKLHVDLSPGLVLGNKRSSESVPRIKRGGVQETDHDHQAKALVQKHSSLAPSDHVFQVVVMRVSIHCQGCAGKVKKHLSKMEAGVTSFSIDVETKRVTVMGHVSPVGVLESISKVKKAEFWPSC
ncbi:heavy metal-associated isoprenylated plant protein 35-like isoform X1 [Juglans microcarpa x Juglans regia]|uniref:heavy metal-associated isoprenylated plant protein 35-like isoform X1 n=1 Tax=Juglans microcarpa x Juglans regia TaxID=2249226 RepID=UPI001B7E99AB|nr:heavy metal-associated isoprenylated plant protein 35-like isoform X1 [Juglans microcarpa x Juglans regia]